MCSGLFTRIIRNRGVHISLKLIFSNIGLCILVALYCIVGAFLFVHFEGHIERDQRRVIYEATLDTAYRRENLRRQIVDYLSECQQQQVDDETCEQSRAIATLAQMLSEYERYVLKMKNESQGFYRGQSVEMDETNAPLNDWSLPSAILFTASILGTIGYGNVAPKTVGGQLAVIIYATFAIPLMSMFLFNVGNWLGDSLRFAYRKVTCKKVEEKRRENRIGPAEKTLPPTAPPSAKQHITTHHDLMLRLEGKKTTAAKKDEGEEEAVPVFLVMLVGMLYIIVGMMLFYGTEDWSLIESLYFTFVSLSTIGFGDYVPNANGKSTLQQMRLVMTTAYLFVGLAIFAMCISLLIDAMRDYKQKMRVLMAVVVTKVKRTD